MPKKYLKFQVITEKLPHREQVRKLSRKEKTPMNTTDFFRKQQEAGHIVERVNSFFDDFQIGILLNKAGIKKLRDAPPSAVLTAIHDALHSRKLRRCARCRRERIRLPALIRLRR